MNPLLALDDPLIVQGRHDDQPGEQYHAIEAFNSGSVSKLLRSPAHFVAHREKGVTPTDSMILGTALHMCLLEPALAQRRIVTAPKFGRKKEDIAAKELFYKTLPPSAIALDEDDMARLNGMVKSLRSHRAVDMLLQGGRSEVSLYWVDGKEKVPCKARIDYLGADCGVIDLKTTSDASKDAFKRSVASWMYHAQAWHYWSAVEAVLHTSPPYFVWIAVESDPPHGVGVYQIGTPSLLAGSRLVSEAMRRYAEGHRTGVWPSYSALIETLDVPRWALTFDEL
jgi:exodeoxyribonuclease VIII